VGGSYSGCLQTDQIPTASVEEVVSQQPKLLNSLVQSIAGGRLSVLSFDISSTIDERSPMLPIACESFTPLDSY